MINKRKSTYILIIYVIIALIFCLYIFYPRSLESALNFKVDPNNDISMKIVKTNYFEDVSSDYYSSEFETDDPQIIMSFMEHIAPLKASRTFDKMNKPAKHSTFGYFILIHDANAVKLLTIFTLDERHIIFSSSDGIKKYKFIGESINPEFIDSLIQ